MNDLLRPDDARDALRKIGGLLLGLGALMLFLRKGRGLDPWGDFPLFLVLGIPAAYLYGLGVFTQRETGGLRVWQTVYSVFGLLLTPLALLKFVDLVGGSPGASLNLLWIFGVTAALGIYAGAVAGIRVQLLLASIALIVSWSALWDKLLSDGISAHFGVYRGLLGILSIGLLAGALHLWRTNPGGDNNATSATGPAGDQGLWKASELLTGAGIAAVLACSLGITVYPTLNPLATTTIPPIGDSTLWDVLLLVVSLGLVSIGSLIGLRGPVYVGAIGLATFLVIVGFDLNEGSHADPTNLGIWPIALLVLGLLAIALSAVKEASLGDRPRQFLEDLRKERHE